MTRISPTHVKAADAVSQVADLFRTVGALTEEIRNDYGEDLIIQTQFEGEADRFRIFGQVKFSSKQPRMDGRISISLKSDHVRRWIGFVEPFRVFVFSSKTGKIYSFDPAQKVSMWDVYTTSNLTFNFTLGEIDELNSDNVIDLVWFCRISHLYRLMAFAQSQIELAAREEREAPEGAKQSISLLSFELLRFLGIAEEDGVNSVYLERLENAARNFAKDADADLGIRAAFMLALLGQDCIANVGLQRHLMENGTEMAGMFVRNYHPDIWKMLKAIHPNDDWEPFGLAE